VFRENPPSRPALRELLPILLPVLGGIAFLSLVVAIIVWLTSLPESAWY
jgi:hypothetical protein